MRNTAPLGYTEFVLRYLIQSVICFILAGGSPPASEDDERILHFERRIRPILAAHCVKCHGPKKQESGLRLDVRAGALKGGELTGPVIDFQNPFQSTLLQAVRHEAGLAMPPDRKLSPAQIRDIEAWLQAGATWPEDSSTETRRDPAGQWKTHWAAHSIRRPPVPTVTHKQRVHSEIDAFVLRRLESRGIEPSPQADAGTLIRRTHFVLTGLPPTAAEVRDFESRFASDSMRAMEELVDRLLNSPHYGERWARHWLDVARYADTKGYVRLSEQPNFYYAYTYRDYVIRAFNEDKPYSEFVREQLAADLLIDGDDNTSHAALGFLTLGRRFTGNQHDIIDDRIDVVTRGLMGLTVTCARCHDHKFDPIATDDYYALYGVFASTTEPSDLPILGMTSDKPVFHGDMTSYHEKRSALEKVVVQYLPPAMNMLRADTTRYLHGVLRGRREFLVPLPAEKGELRQTFV